MNIGVFNKNRYFERSGSCLGSSWNGLGGSWGSLAAILGRSWAVLGRSRNGLGAFLGQSWGSEGDLGDLGAVWGENVNFSMVL